MCACAEHSQGMGVQILILQLFHGNWFKTVIVYHLIKELPLEQLILTLDSVCILAETSGKAQEVGIG